MKKIPKKKWFLVIAVVIFLIITFIRAQRSCVATSAFNFFYETKTEEGAKFKNVFSKTTVQVVYKDMSGLVTIKEGDSFVVVANNGTTFEIHSTEDHLYIKKVNKDAEDVTLKMVPVCPSTVKLR